jgi:hypothetical protein
MSRKNGLRRAYAQFHAYGIRSESRHPRQGCVLFFHIQGSHIKVGYNPLDETLPSRANEQQIFHIEVSSGPDAGLFGANRVSTAVKLSQSSIAMEGLTNVHGMMACIARVHLSTIES